MEDIDDAEAKLLANGVSVVRDIHDVPTGQRMYMEHVDGGIVDYVQWTPELFEQHIFAPLRAVTPASQI